jgi:hypothetical protein
MDFEACIQNKVNLVFSAAARNRGDSLRSPVAATINRNEKVTILSNLNVFENAP